MVCCVEHVHCRERIFVIQGLDGVEKLFCMCSLDRKGLRLQNQSAMNPKQLQSCMHLRLGQRKTLRLVYMQTVMKKG